MTTWIIRCCGTRCRRICRCCSERSSRCSRIWIPAGKSEAPAREAGRIAAVAAGGGSGVGVIHARAAGQSLPGRIVSGSFISVHQRSISPHPGPPHEPRSSRRKEAPSISAGRSQSLLTSAATVRGFNARTFSGKSLPICPTNTERENCFVGRFPRVGSHPPSSDFGATSCASNPGLIGLTRARSFGPRGPSVSPNSFRGFPSRSSP